MIRIHLTPEDLRRITVAGPDELREVVISASVIGKSRLPSDERRRIAARVGPVARPLLQLAANPYGPPDFLTPAVGGDFDATLDVALSAPDEQLRAELAPYERLSWTRDPDLVRELLSNAVREYGRIVLAHYWDGATAGVVADRAIRATMLAEGGVDLLLATLHPNIHWTYPVLTMPCVETFQFHLRGQGLRLMPTYFLSRPSVLDAQDGPFELYYPARVDTGGSGNGRGPLQPLLGRTRAAVLTAIGRGATTSQIASRLGISIASASEHATVLRNAGLIASARLRNTVVHSVTPLGSDLLTTANR